MASELDWRAALESSDTAERCQAAEELSRLGEEARPAAVALVRACDDPSEEVREWAVAALEEIGSPFDTDLPALASLLSKGSSDVAYWAATLLGRSKDAAAPAVPALARALATSPHQAVRQRAAWALGAIGPAASAARMDLDQATASADPRLADLARVAIRSINES